MRQWDVVTRQTPLVLREEYYAWAPTPTPPHCIDQETMYPPNIYLTSQTAIASIHLQKKQQLTVAQ
jgi:hypothetical protein